MHKRAKLISETLAKGMVDIDYFQFSLIVAMAIGFGLALRALYLFYFKDKEAHDGSLARGLVILTPALTALFWMAQASLTLALGLLGSMSLIRFRTPISRVEDIAFIAVMVAVAIALAVKAPMIAVILLGSLFLYTLGKNRAGRHFKARGRSLTVITFNTSKALSCGDLLAVLAKAEVPAEFVSSRVHDGTTSYVLSSHKVQRAMHDQLQKCLIELDGTAQINIFYPGERLGA